MNLGSKPAPQSQTLIDETKKQESIEYAKTLRAAITLRATQASHKTDPWIKIGAALSGATSDSVTIAVATNSGHTATLHMAPVGDTQPGAKPQASSSAPDIVLGPHVDFGAQISDKTVDVRGTGVSGSYTVDQGRLPKEVTEQDVKQMLKFASEFLSQKANEQATAGNTQQAENWVGIRDTFEQLKTFAWRLSGFDKFGKSYNDKLLIAALRGSTKGASDFVQGTKQLILHPQETMQQFEQLLNRLDRFAGQLFRNNPEAKAKITAAIKACWDCPSRTKS